MPDDKKTVDIDTSGPEVDVTVEETKDEAVVETEDYRKGHKDSSTALFGMRAETKARAFQTAFSFVK